MWLRDLRTQICAFYLNIGDECIRGDINDQGLLAKDVECLLYSYNPSFNLSPYRM